MKIYVLIMLFRIGLSDYTVVHEFNSLDNCKNAAEALIKQAGYTNNKGEFYSNVKAWGCYDK